MPPPPSPDPPALDTPQPSRPQPRPLTRSRPLPAFRGAWTRLAAALIILNSTPAPAATLSTPRAPRIGYLFPAGGRQGTSFEVHVGGQYLNGVTRVHCSGTGVEATVLEHQKPMTQKQANALREQLNQFRKEIQSARKQGHFQTPAEGLDLFFKWMDQKGVSRDDLIQLAELRQQRSDPKRQPNPQLSETVRLRVTLAPDAEPGSRELRVAGRAGVSNPIIFRVGQLPEFIEPRAPLDLAREYLPPDRAGIPATPRATPPAHRVTMPTVVNGQILPGEVDQCRFSARKGQQVVAAVEARALIPYLADAVPGWFQATIALRDAKSREVAYADDYRFHPDPALRFVIPETGEYLLEIRDSIYRGREDFVYRVTLGEIPFVTSVFPLGCRAGSETIVALEGWNLPVNSVVFHAQNLQPGRYPLNPTALGHGLKPVPFAVDALPESQEQEPNPNRQSAQAVRLPVIVNGLIHQAGDTDVFLFEGKAGETVVLAVTARQLNSPLDAVLTLTDARGRQLAFNDDQIDPAAGLLTHHADSYLHCSLPADGCYFVHLADAQNQGGSAYAYRLRLSPPQADFHLRLTPATLNARAGSTLPLTVHALRQDGFDGPIHLKLTDSPDGFKLDGNWLPAGQAQTRIALTVPTTPLPTPCSLRLEGCATIDGVEVVRPVLPCEDMMQAFFYRHLVPAKQWIVSVSGPPRRPRQPPVSSP